MSKRKREIYVEFLNRCGLDIDTMPPECWALFRHFKYKDFIIAMVKEDKNTMSIGQLSIKYDMTPRHIKYLLYEK